MPSNELEALVKDVNIRVDRVEQILPTLATKQDVLGAIETARQDLVRVVAATNEELLAAMEVRDQRLVAAMSVAMLALEERLRTHMGVLHEDSKSDSRLLAEHLAHLTQRLDRLERRL